MDLDNPSYFSMLGEPSTLFNNGSIRRTHNKMCNADSISSASDCSLSRQSTPPKGPRLNLRYLRSVSSNSADSNQELFLMGEPRLSDIAPEIAFKNHPASRSNSLKNKQDIAVHDGLIYTALPTSEEGAAADLSDGEVFISEESTKYYNYSALRGQRRHSIGTFMAGRERSNSAASSSRSFKEDFPQAIVHATSDGESVGSMIDEHALRHGSYPRKRCPKCNKGTLKKSTDMDDILIIALKGSETANLWVEYFSSYFQQITKQANRKPFKIQYFWAEDCLNESEEETKVLTEKRTNVKLQLVVVCPGFLQFIAESSEKCRIFSRTFVVDRTLALLLGVIDNDLNEIHKRILPSYFQWQRLSVGQDQDANFTKEFLGQAVAILSRVWKQQCSVSNQDKVGFSVSPKKIRQGQTSVFILLTYPIQKEDTLKVSVERNNEIFEVKSVKRRNPYTVKISVPDSLTEMTAIVNILVEKNGSIVGSRPIKCESRLRELEQILRLTNNPIEFMSQTLGFNPASNKEHLDNWLLQAFQRNLPSHFNLLANHMSPFAASIRAHKHSHEEFPTLLHFAAKFGFEKLALQLLDCPGGDVAYDIRNVYDMTPSDIAESNGHTHLATTLRGYMNMNEFSNMYTKLKEMSVDEDSYLTPKCINEVYKTCPAPRPVTIDLSKQHSIYHAAAINEMSSSNGYMAMNTPVTVIIERDESVETCKESSKTITSKNIEQNSPKISNQQIPKNCEILEDRVQKELLEIMNDFKNNVHSISQVEKLVEEWKNRNDVQKSFKEKQEQLNEMRMKYEKIQQEMKAAMKKPTPFDRVKKLFGRSKSRDDKQEISTPVLTSPSIIAIQTQRPISSLSTSSSGSSGRMSTISGSSLGDSGTHSDNEERKNILHHHDEEFRNDLNKIVLELNYSPVPAPKPVKNPNFLNKNKLFETIQEKPLQRPDTLPIKEEYYIQFPPSGLPISGVVNNKGTTPDQEYMNVSPCNDEKNPEYMNFKIVTNR